MSTPQPQPPQPLSSATSSSFSSKNQPQPSSSTTLSVSSITIPSDSENYDGNNELSSSSSGDHSLPEFAPSSPLQQQQQQQQPPVILYTPPTLWSLFRGVAINLFLPFVNGLMLGFGELFAHEIAFRLGWSGTKVGYHSSFLFFFIIEEVKLRWVGR